MPRIAIPNIQFQTNDRDGVRLEKMRRLAQAVEEIARTINAEPSSGGTTLTPSAPVMTGPALLGRLEGTGPALSLSSSQVISFLPTFTATVKGLVPSPGTATNNRFLRDDGSWVVAGAGSYATPSALVGLVPKTGLAGTGMRSDGAPALDPNIAPNWTAQHSFVLTPDVPDESWAYAKIQDATALSVVGRASNTGGVLADIVASADVTVLRRAGASVSFGSIDSTYITNFDAVVVAAVVGFDHGLLGGLGDNDHPQYSRFRTVEKMVDETIASDDTLATDDTLFFAMAANTKYRLRGRVFFDTTAVAGFKYRHAGPAAPDLVRVHRRDIYPGGVSDLSSVVDIAYSADDIVIGGGTGDGGYIELDGIIHNGANAGDFTFQWAQEVSDATDTTVLAGSYLEFARIGRAGSGALVAPSPVVAAAGVVHHTGTGGLTAPAAVAAGSGTVA